MKKSLSMFLMILSLLIGFRQGIIIVHFKLNQKAIAERYCENKDKPALRCHGQCQLRKQLQKANGGDMALLHIILRGDMLPTAMTELEMCRQEVLLPKLLMPHRELAYSAPSLEILVPPPIGDLFMERN